MGIVESIGKRVGNEIVTVISERYHRLQRILSGLDPRIGASQRHCKGFEKRGPVSIDRKLTSRKLVCKSWGQALNEGQLRRTDVDVHATADWKEKI